MKKIIAVIFLFCNLSVFSQDKLSINKEDIVGRWVEDIDVVSDSIEKYPYTYIFRDNMVFHLGEANEGVILFNITGKYTLEGDLISIVYYDFIHGRAENRKANYVTYRILSLDNDKMTLLAKDQEYEYKVFLKKQNF